LEAPQRRKSTAGIERSTKTFDDAAAGADVVVNEGTKIGAHSAKEGTNAGADERNEGTNSAAAGLKENSGASALRDRKGLVGKLLTGEGETSMAAGADEVRIRGISSTTAS
jgi:hypothetical protein